MIKRIFSQHDNYFDIKNKIYESLVFLCEDKDSAFIQEGLNAFVRFEDKSRIESFAKKVDSLYSSKYNDCVVPMILYGVIVMSHRMDFADNLSDEALALFSQVNHKNSSYLFEELDYAISWIFPEVLNLICNKTKDVSYRLEYYVISEEMLSDEDVSQESRTKSVICDRIKNMTNSECIELQKKYFDDDEIAKIAESINFKI